MQAEKRRALAKKIVFFVAVILLWQLIFYLTTSVFHIWKPYMFPSPLGVAKTFYSLVAGNTLLVAVGTSLRRVFLGYFLSIVIGTALGLLIYRFSFLNETLKPVFLGLQTLPSICWLPFAILWFGLNESAILFVIVIGSTFSITIAVDAGMKSVNPLFIKAGRTMGANRIKLFANVILPDSLPHILVGLKQGWSFCWRALMNGEMLSATKGLGQILMLGRDLSDINQVMCIMVVIIVLGVSIDRLLFGLMENRMRKNRGLARNEN